MLVGNGEGLYTIGDCERNEGKRTRQRSPALSRFISPIVACTEEINRRIRSKRPINRCDIACPVYPRSINRYCPELVHAYIIALLLVIDIDKKVHSVIVRCKFDIFQENEKKLSDAA